MITSDFESQSHEQLRAMIADADPKATQALGDRLKAAGVAIGKIGEDLRTYMSHVNWEGEAGDAFRTWGANMVNATTRLGEFSDKAGTWMGHAAETLSTVKSSMPEYSSASKATLNSYLSQHPGGFLLKPPASSDAPKPGGGVLAGPTPEAATAAQKRLDEDHAEAVRLMRKLAGSYVWSAHNMGQVERPQFQPIRDAHMPRDQRRETEYVPNPGGVSSPAFPASGVSANQIVRDGEPGQATYASGVASRDAGASGVTGTVTSASPGSSPVGMDVDGGVATPNIPISQSGGTAGPPPVDRALDRIQLPPTPGVPPMGPIGKTGATREREVGGPRPRVAPGAPVEGIGGGVAPRQGVGGGGVPGQGAVGGRVNMPAVGAPTDGIVGGRPVPRATGPSSAQVPRGTVIGTEPSTGRPPMGHGIGGVMPGAPAGRAAGGQASGRRLATESGGVVGGRAQQRAAGAADRPFTQGGTGLVRSQGEANRSRGASRQRHGEGRPDYLVEEDGSWQQGSRRVVPPVIR
ncbi:WXG100 family type VII secretion target [Streptomyces netropsis]